MKQIVFIILLLSNISTYSETLKVGVLQFAPPFSSRSDNSNHYYGFVISLMNAICQRIHIECDFVAIPKKGELTGLNSGLYDITFSPTPITAALPDSYIYSLPYLPSNGQFLTLKSDAIQNTQDIKFKKIGFYKINFHENPILSKYTTNNTFIEFSDPAELVNALNRNKINVILINYYAARYIITSVSPSTKDSFMLVGGKIPIGNGYGIITVKNRAALIDEINHALLDMETDGSYLKIYNEYFGYSPIHTPREPY